MRERGASNVFPSIFATMGRKFCFTCQEYEENWVCEGMCKHCYLESPRCKLCRRRMSRVDRATKKLCRLCYREKKLALLKVIASAPRKVG